MSQYPPYPPDNQGYGAPDYYNAPLPNAKPASVTGLAITGIVLGSAGILCRGCGAIGATIMVGNGGKNPLMPSAPIIQDHAVHVATLYGAYIDLFFWIFLLVGSIAALNLKPFARRGLIFWSVGMLLWQMIWFVLQVVILLPAMEKMMTQIQAQQGRSAPPMPFNGMINGMMIGGYIFWLAFCSVLPILILWMWTRPHVKAAFEESQPPPQA